MCVRGEVGLTFLHGLRIPVDPNELRLWGRVEDPTRVPTSTERGVEEDSALLQCGQEQFDDSVGENGLVFHIAIVREPW